MLSYCEEYAGYYGRFGTEYMRGLVQVNRHSVLPNVTPGGALACTLICAIVSLVVARHHSIWHHVSISCLSFFLFGWHVHEKAILMVLLPLQYFFIQTVFPSFPQTTLSPKLYFQPIFAAANPYLAGANIHNSVYCLNPFLAQSLYRG